jgi:hypothetical protein
VRSGQWNGAAFAIKIFMHGIGANLTIHTLSRKDDLPWSLLSSLEPNIALAT